MKSLIVYSSLTGNTKQVAEAVAQAMPNSSLYAVEEAPSYKDYDIVAIGYWVDKGLPDKKILDYFATLGGAKVILFGTLGAYPDSEHGTSCMKKSEALVLEKSADNKVLGSFLCMGKVDPKLLEAMAKNPNHAHAMTEERRKRIEEGNKHPNEEDFANVQKFIVTTLEKHNL